MALLMFLHYLHYCSCLVYCQIFLEYAIEVVTTAIFGEIPGFLGGFKGVLGAMLSYHVSVIDPLSIPLSSLPIRVFMDS